MKTKTILSNVLSAVILFALVSGFQIESSKGNLTLSDRLLGVEQAYAGPCKDAKCDGEPGFCGLTTVVKIFGIRIVKECVGSEPGEFPELNSN